jgi:flagellar protein FliO/FliZ
LGGDKLKFIIKKGRLPWAVYLFVLLFSINNVCVYAQSETTEEPFSAEQVVDPITAAERALPLGGGDDAAPVPSGGGASIWVIVRMLLVLVLAAAAIYGVVFFIKKAGRRSADVEDPYLKILASAHLGGGRYAQVVSLGSKAWLIGVSDGGVNLISDIEDQEIVDAMLLDESTKSAERGAGRLPDFKAILGRFGVKVKSGPPGPENIRKRRERLKGWK